MAIVTPRFTFGVTVYDLPHANLFDRRMGYTSIPIRMANGYTQWQTFAIEGDEDPSDLFYVTLGWAAMTNSEKNVLLSVFSQFRLGNRATFRAPDEGQYYVTIDPDRSDLDLRAFVSGQVWYWEASINLLQDSA